MKIKFVKIILAVSLIFLSSCKEYFITTKINSDGTVERNIAYKTDENDTSSFPETFLADKSWKSSKQKDTANKKTIINLSSKFNSYEDAVKELGKQREGFEKIIDIKIEKSFRFFFTYYTYKESYRPFNRLNKTPLEKYFNRDEIEKLKAATDTAWVKEKLDAYTQHNMVDMFLDTVEELLLKEHQIRMETLLPAGKRKELISELIKVDKDDENNEKAIKVLSRYFDNAPLKLITGYIENNEPFQKLLEDMSRYDGTYENSVIMPGIITYSNSKSIEGNKVSWKFDQERFKFFEYEMLAESREVNVWVIIAAGIVVLLLIGLLILPRVWRRGSV